MTDSPPAPPRHQLAAAAGRVVDFDPYLGAQAVVGGAILLDLLLPARLTLGPSWLLPAVEAVLLAVLVAATPHRQLRHSPIRRRMALVLIALVSLVNLVSLVLLVHFLLHHDVANGRQLIIAGVLLWGTNVLLFGLWYWQLDRGGPVDRRMGAAADPDFLFPQMSEPHLGPENWMPGLIDYLYVSFTNATAFSPTDTMPLSQTAKVLMAVQSLGALATIGLVVARAVNIL